MQADCIFCKIIAGTVPSVNVYEDSDALAFMDIGPVIKGHTLVIPKAHSVGLLDTPPELLGKLMAVVQRVAAAQIAGLGAEGVNILQANGDVAGQVVPHIHFHVVPRYAGDGHHWNWRAKSYDDNAEMKSFAQRIAGALR